MNTPLAIVPTAFAVSSLVVPAWGQACDLSQTAYESYAVSSQVKRYAPGEDFPTETDEIEPYAISAATPAVVLLVFALCLCCCLCCYNCCLCKRLNKSGRCVPGEKYAKFELSLKNPWRVGCWGLLITMAILLYVFDGIGLSTNSQQSQAIRDLPGSLGVYSDFIGGDLVDAIKCINSLVGYIEGNATDLVAQATNNTEIELLNEIIGNSTDITSELVDEAETELLNVASNISDFEEDLRKTTDDVGDRNSAFVKAVLAVIIIVASCQILTATVQGISENVRKMYCLAITISQFIVLVIFLTLVLATAYNLVISVFAGFCKEPVDILVEVIGNSSDTDERALYYLQCATYSDAEKESLWPWNEEQQKTDSAFQSLNDSMTELEDLLQQSNTDNLDTTNLRVSIDALGGTFSNDNGVFGWRGLLACGVVDRFLQAIFIDLCTDLFDPTSLLFEVLVVLAFVMCCTDIIHQHLRREENADGDEEDGYTKYQDSPDPVKNPSYQM